MQQKWCVRGVVMATALVASSAFAQSSVTVSGTLDMGVLRDYDKVTKVGGISRSNIAFSGVEDLGSGLAATFKLNSRFKVSDGTQEDSSRFFSSESTVGLKGSFGHIRLGRALTALWHNDWGFDPWYNYDSIASPAWFLWHGNMAADPNVSAKAASFARLNSGIFYNSPVMRGFSVSLSGGVQKQTADTNRSLSGVLKYESKTFSAMVGAERNPIAIKDTFVAAKYDFGPVALMGAIDYEDFGSVSSVNLASKDYGIVHNGTKNRSGTLGLTIPVGQAAFNLGYGRQQDFHANFFSAGALYNLSKRTYVYTSLGRKGNNFNGTAAAANAFGIGINHSF